MNVDQSYPTLPVLKASTSNK